MTHADRVREALEDNAGQVFDTLTTILARLGSNEEWSMDDNFETTETIAALAGVIGLPSAADQSVADLDFWRELANEVGVDYKVDESIGGPTLGAAMYDEPTTGPVTYDVGAMG